MAFLGQALGSLTGGIADASGVRPADVRSPVSDKQNKRAYNQTQRGLDAQMRLLQALQAQGGIQNQQNVYNQLAQVAAGQGPNPAQAMLNQATGQNVANQAALMAGQRGANANVGLMSRQIANQGAQVQQQAANQAALLQAQQSLGAFGQMGDLANQQVGQQMNATGGYNQFAQGQQQNLLGSIANENQAQVSNQQGINNARQAITGGVFQGLGSGAAAGAKMYLGGEVQGPQSFVGRHLAQYACGGPVMNATQGGPVPGDAMVRGDSLKNDTVPAMLSPKEIVLPRSVTMAPDAPKRAAEFVAAVMGRQGLRRKA